jgi:hypothetical protein
MFASEADNREVGIGRKAPHEEFECFYRYLHASTRHGAAPVYDKHIEGLFLLYEHVILRLDFA